MGYLIAKDYQKQIQDDVKGQVISNDSGILIDAENAAIAEIYSLISTKYNVSKEFANTTIYDSSVVYKSDSLVLYNSELYYITPPADGFDFNKAYSIDDEVLWNDKVYTALKASVPISQTEALQYIKTAAIPYINYEPGTPLGASYWGTGVAYSVTGILPTDATKWTKGDNRNALIVMYMVDITLYHVHSRIAPRNIPQLRIDRYNMAINALKEVNDGSRLVDMPMNQPKTYTRFLIGTNVARNNYY